MTTTMQPETGMSDEQWNALLARLSHQSVEKNFDPYVDIAWDAPEMQILPHDPQFVIGDDDALGASEWYRQLPADTQADIGIHLMACRAKTGLQFENILKRGLLLHAFWMGNNDPEFRYVYHEVVEETNHGMMFQEFVNRTGMNPKGLPLWQKIASARVVQLGRVRPTVFFFFVLGGEDPIDWVQRDALRKGGLHPLLERIARIHTTEEARHVSFARQYLRREVPRLNRAQRLALSIVLPILLQRMSASMMALPPEVARRWKIPRDVVRACGSPSHPITRYRADQALSKMHKLAGDTGLLNPLAVALWKALRIWPKAGGAA